MKNSIIFYNPLLMSRDIHIKKYSENISLIFKDYLSNLISSLENADYYVFDDDHYKKNTYDPFVNDIIKIVNQEGSKPYLHVISGKAGVGKTTFFSKALPSIIGFSSKKYFPDDIIHIIDFRTNDENSDIYFYQELILEKIYQHAVKRATGRFCPGFTDFVKRITGTININVSIDLCENDKRNLAIAYYLTEMSAKIGYPILYIIDNIDLCSEKTQKNVAAATNNVFRLLQDTVSSYTGLKGRFRIFIVKRPETHIDDEIGNFENPIDFPEPNLGKIFIYSFFSYLKSVTDETIFNNINLTLYNSKQLEVTVKNPCEFARYIYDYMYDMWINSWTKSVEERFGLFNDFHTQLVNGNVRRFIRFLAFTVQVGGLEFLNSDRYKKDYSVFDYVRMLFSGPFEFHPGNRLMDGEGFDRFSPITMNIYDSSSMGRKSDQFIENYLIFIRILQYFEIKYQEEAEIISLNDIYNDIGPFYSKEYIEIALKKLLFANIITEVSHGVRNLQHNKRWDDIDLNSTNGGINFSTNGSSTNGFYIRHLVVEYEYLFQMCVRAYLFVDNNDEQTKKTLDYISSTNSIEIKKKRIFEKKEELVFIFIKSISLAIIENLNQYKERNVYNKFKEIFCPEHIVDLSLIHPWRRTISCFINVLGNKRARLKKEEENDKVYEMDKLITRSEQLKDEMIERFREFAI